MNIHFQHEKKSGEIRKKAKKSKEKQIPVCGFAWESEYLIHPRI